MATTATKHDQQTLLQMEEQFANDVGKGTGFDPRVILAQEQIEGAYAPGGTGGLNFLNLKASTVSSLGQPYAGSSSGGFAQFASLGQAESATIAEFKSPAIGISTPGPTPAYQISQIAASPWDGGHYSGGTNVPGTGLITVFAELFGKQPLNEPSSLNTEGFGGILHGIFFGPATPSQLGGGGNITPIQYPGANLLPSGGLGSLLGLPNIPNLLQRGGEMLAGGVLIILGVVAIIRGGSGSPAAQTRGAVRVVTRGAVK